MADYWAKGIIALLVVGTLTGCQTGSVESSGIIRTNVPVKEEFTSFGDTFEGLATISDVDYYADDQLLAEAKNQFRSENYGNAGYLFHKAVSVSPNDGEAWLGLAACADRIGRFDLSDQAYRQAYRLIGNTPEYYNNVGYSYLLRGKLVQARKSFLKAYELAPNDPTVANNIQLLSTSVKNIER